jgi:hypothetical protein
MRSKSTASGRGRCCMTPKERKKLKQLARKMDRLYRLVTTLEERINAELYSVGNIGDKAAALSDEMDEFLAESR